MQAHCIWARLPDQFSEGVELFRNFMNFLRVIFGELLKFMRSLQKNITRRSILCSAGLMKYALSIMMWIQLPRDSWETVLRLSEDWVKNSWKSHTDTRTHGHTDRATSWAPSGAKKSQTKNIYFRIFGTDITSWIINLSRILQVVRKIHAGWNSHHQLYPQVSAHPLLRS